ncbi:hypothetical protein F511_09804 [Dorcoceras hygrometricum]|uniref:Uncharacterized protein n=1 Tax=Dorcoceras hygrometricum TaxID=472368 RepID=A0A2Z7BUC5_9LAMI|nr:hypothetical protein F511_09804 [Dorcoceras hygrometricum]
MQQAISQCYEMHEAIKESLTTVHATTEHQHLNAHKFSRKNAAMLTASSDDPYC